MFLVFSCYCDKKSTSESSFCKLLFGIQPACPCFLIFANLLEKQKEI